mmetsp:Transcript_6545/g.15119  ORF Transcript_6545/g.15119 Transcript_6545/m.15119 type:complete len:383 (+) Transcript_6545:56-1204(+)
MPDALPSGHFLFASEATTEGHFDKVCDRVADAVLDTCLTQDADSHVLCEACAKSGMVMILGEVVSKASIQYEQVIREAVKAIGYDSDEKGLDWRTMNVIVAIEDQGPDIAASLGSQRPQLTDDQAIACGYATDETEEAMPLSHSLATRLCAKMDQLRRDGLAWLRPDARVQVTLEYKEDSDGALLPQRVHSISIIYSHLPEVKPAAAEKDLMEKVVKHVVPEKLLDSSVRYVFSPRARRGVSEAGFSGRRCDCDTYGGWAPAGVLSGRDGFGLSRCAAYGARWAARSLVAAKLCRRCEVQLSFNPLQAEVATVQVRSFGSSRSSGKTDAQLAEILMNSFDFRQSSLQRDLNLKGPQFQRFSAYGHFGHKDMDLPWEKPKALR